MLLWSGPKTRSRDSSGGCDRSTRRMCAPQPNVCGSLLRSPQVGIGSGSTSLGTHTHRGLRWTISKESPSCSVIHLLSSAPRYPASAHNKCPRPGKDSPTRSSSTLAPSRSASSAECTLTFITSPLVSTKRCRLRPFTFLAPSYPRTPLFLRSSPTGCPRWPRSELLGDLPEGGFAPAE